MNMQYSNRVHELKLSIIGRIEKKRDLIFCTTTELSASIKDKSLTDICLFRYGHERVLDSPRNSVMCFDFRNAQRVIATRAESTIFFPSP